MSVLICSVSIDWLSQRSIAYSYKFEVVQRCRNQSKKKSLERLVAWNHCSSLSILCMLNAFRLMYFVINPPERMQYRCYSYCRYHDYCRFVSRHEEPWVIFDRCSEIFLLKGTETDTERDTERSIIVQWSYLKGSEKACSFAWRSYWVVAFIVVGVVALGSQFEEVVGRSCTQVSILLNVVRTRRNSMARVFKLQLLEIEWFIYRHPWVFVDLGSFLTFDFFKYETIIYSCRNIWILELQNFFSRFPLILSCSRHISLSNNKVRSE